MNIFYVDENPVIAAQSLCNKHVIKMILESAQLLSTAHHVWAEQNGHYIVDSSLLYKKTHVNHPCAVWCRASHSNYHWLADHAIALCEEYTFRYDNFHKSEPLIRLLKLKYPLYKYGLPTQPAQAMPDEYKVINNAVEAYRNYYNKLKSKVMKTQWTKREQPKWFQGVIDEYQTRENN